MTDLSHARFDRRPVGRLRLLYGIENSKVGALSLDGYPSSPPSPLRRNSAHSGLTIFSRPSQERQAPCWKCPPAMCSRDSGTVLIRVDCPPLGLREFGLVCIAQGLSSSRRNRPSDRFRRN